MARSKAFLGLASATLILLVSSSTACAKWQWSSRQLRQLKNLEKKVTTDGERRKVESTHWLVEAEASREKSMVVPTTTVLTTTR